MNKINLSQEEIRVLGALIEKELTTPEYYPLTANSLMSACNQTTNRNPVVNYNIEEIEKILTSLREKNLCRRGVYPGSRVPKHRHILEENFDSISIPEKAILSILFLRGDQTLGEIKQRTERMYSWQDIIEVDSTIEAMAKSEDPFLIRLPKLPGQKEARIKHAFNLDSDISSESNVLSKPSSIEELFLRLASLEKRVEELEAKK